MTNDKQNPADKIVGSTDGLGCNTGGLGCCAREANEVDLAMGHTCQNCSMVRTEWDDTVYICDPRGKKVSDGMTCNAFDAT